MGRFLAVPSRIDMRIDDPVCLQSTSLNRNATTGSNVDGCNHDVQVGGT